MPIFDQGYQHWSGELSGHAWRWLAITRHGVRNGMKSRILRIALIVSWLPAIVLALALCAWGMVERKFDLISPIATFFVHAGVLDPRVIADPVQFRVVIWTLCFNLFLSVELYLSMFLILLVGPSLISQDLRFNALPLYFSRPLRRIDYFLGKLGIVAAFLGMVIIVPSLLAYVLGVLFSLDITIVRDTFPLLLSILAYGLVIALSAGSLILALSSLSRNSRYIALFWLVIWSVSSVTAFTLNTVDYEQRRHASYSKVFAAQQNVAPAPQADRDKQLRDQRAMQNSWQKADEEFQAESIQLAKTNWRPIISYTGNLSRIGYQLLGTEKAWNALAQLQPANQRDRFLMDFGGPQFPWYWSAAVLVALLGLSACILNFRVKSLDRLR
jgi:ABC-2 type transport system permease protein